MRKYSCRTWILLATGLSCLGTVLRCVTADPRYSPYVVTAGSIVNGCALPFYTLIPPRITSVWFEPSRRSTAHSFANNASTFGTMLAFLSGFFITTSAQVPKLLLMEAISMTILFLTCVIYFPVAPPTPPSPSADEQDKAERNGHHAAGFFSDFRQLSQKSSFWRLAIGYGLIRGLQNGWSSQMVFLLEPVGFTQANLAVMGVIYPLLVLPIGFFVSRIIDSHPRRLKALIIAENALALIAFGLFFPVVDFCRQISSFAPHGTLFVLDYLECGADQR